MNCNYLVLPNGKAIDSGYSSSFCDVHELLPSLLPHGKAVVSGCSFSLVSFVTIIAALWVSYGSSCGYGAP